jgi:hypothetical protein
MQIFRLKSNREYNHSSTYLGINWDKQYKKWRASIVVDGRKMILGYFDDEKEAARKYNEAATRHGRNVLNILAATEKKGQAA